MPENDTLRFDLIWVCELLFQKVPELKNILDADKKSNLKKINEVKGDIESASQGSQYNTFYLSEDIYNIYTSPNEKPISQAIIEGSDDDREVQERIPEKMLERFQPKYPKDRL